MCVYMFSKNSNVLCSRKYRAKKRKLLVASVFFKWDRVHIRVIPAFQVFIDRYVEKFPIKQNAIKAIYNKRCAMGVKKKQFILGISGKLSLKHTHTHTL